MAALDLKPASSCTFDQISLGEIMLRLDPGAGRIRTARQFRVWEGGGEYSVPRELRRCLGRKTAAAVAAYPNFKVVATTLRAAKTATRNDWGAICWTNGMFFEGHKDADLEIFDRVGGGDSFASGLIYGFPRSRSWPKAAAPACSGRVFFFTTKSAEGAEDGAEEWAWTPDPETLPFRSPCSLRPLW